MGIPSGKEIKYWLFLAVFVIVVIAFIRLLLPFLAPLILSAIIVSIFTPVYYFLNRWLPQSISSLICCGLICVIIFIPFIVIITIVANQALTLYSSAMNSEFMQNLTAGVNSNWVVSNVNYYLDKLNLGFTISGEQIYQLIGRMGSRFGSFLYAQATNISGNFIRIIINFFFMVLISYYLFGNGRRVIDFFVGLSPLPEGMEVAVLQRLKTTAGAIFFGNFISGVIQGTIGGITLWYFGFPAPFLWAVVMVILAFLPIVGIGLVFVPCIVITFIGGEYTHAVIMAVIYVASSSITEYIIIPRLQGKRSQMHTVFIFLAVLGGLQVFGLIGVLYGPLIVTAFLALYELYRLNYMEASRVSVLPSGIVSVMPAVINKLNGMEPVSGKPKKKRKAAAAKPAFATGTFLTDDNVALGDDIEPEFHENTGEPVITAANAPEDSIFEDTAAANANATALNEHFGDDLGALSDYPGNTYADDRNDDEPLACQNNRESEESDGLIWSDTRPAHLPFPRAEGAERLLREGEEDVTDISIKDIVRADITSFELRAEEIKKEKEPLSDKRTKE